MILKQTLAQYLIRFTLWRILQIWLVDQLVFPGKYPNLVIGAIFFFFFSFFLYRVYVCMCMYKYFPHKSEFCLNVSIEEIWDPLPQFFLVTLRNLTNKNMSFFCHHHFLNTWWRWGRRLERRHFLVWLKWIELPL